ncbi:MAG: metal ABC transporter permease [Acidobacteriota bacterium]
MLYFTDMADNPFLAAGLAVGLLASIACGVVGPWVVHRRMVFLAGAVAHIAIGGVGASIFLAHRWPTVFGGMRPLVGATLSSVLAALLLAWLTHRGGARLDAMIGALWATGMAVGILLVKLTPGYQTELMSYLFGNLSLATPADLKLLVALDIVVLIVAIAYHKQFFALCFDREQARLQGIRLLQADAVLLVLVALTVITLTQIVGLLLVIALLSLPATTAARHSRTMLGGMMLSVVLCAVVTIVPRVAVYGTAIGPEPAIILSAAALYGASLLSSVLGLRAQGPT